MPGATTPTGASSAWPTTSDAYNGELDKSQWGLHEVAQMCNYYGSIWATWDTKAPSFEDYLGALSRPASAAASKASDGEDNGVELFNRSKKWRLPTNWKFPAFSFAGDARTRP